MFEQIIKLCNEAGVIMSLNYDNISNVTRFLVYKDNTHFSFGIDNSRMESEEHFEFTVLQRLKEAIKVLKGES